jgi:hypothetical protein
MPETSPTPVIISMGDSNAHANPPAFLGGGAAEYRTARHNLTSAAIKDA